MATTVARLQAVLDADTSAFDRKMGQSQTKTQKFGAVAKTALIGGAAAGVTALGVAAKIGWDEYNQGAQVAAQTNAAIKSTGGIAGVTAKHVEDLGASMLKLTGIDDEATKSAENQLLTFTKIGMKGGVFDRATQATADLATRLNGGAIPSFEQMNSTAILVGKGLNNPISGLTRLKRVGVEFTDQQTAQITKLTESGRVTQAQTMILKVLETQYGGSAKAAGETFAGSIQKLHERMNNWLGMVVGKAIPYIERFAKWIGPILGRFLEATGKFISDVRERTDKMGQVFGEHRETISKVVKVLKFLGEAIIFVWKWEAKLYLLILDVWLKILSVTLSVTDKIIAAFGKVIDASKRVVDFFQRIWEVARPVFTKVAEIITDKLIGPFKTAVGWASKLVGFIKDAVEWIGKIDFPSVPDLNPFNGDGIVGAAQNPGGLAVNILDDLGLANSMGLALTPNGGFRPGSITSSGNASLHSVGRAIDVAGTPAAMTNFFRAEVGRAASTGLAEIIHSPYWWHPGSGVTRISDGQILADHWDHVHVGTYDRGGYLRPGWNLAYNGTGRPEAVGGGLTVNVMGNVIAERDLRSLIARLQDEHRKRGGR